MSVDETNPYASPKGEVEPEAPRRRQWRKLPAAILMMIGGMCVLFSVGKLDRLPFVLVGDGGVSNAKEVVGFLLYAITGLIWIAGGVAVWKGMWWRAALSIVVGYSLGLVASNLAFPGKLH